VERKKKKKRGNRMKIFLGFGLMAVTAYLKSTFCI